MFRVIIQHQHNTEKTDAPEVPGASSYQELLASLTGAA